MDHDNIHTNIIEEWHIVDLSINSNTNEDDNDDDTTTGYSEIPDDHSEIDRMKEADTKMINRFLYDDKDDYKIESEIKTQNVHRTSEDISNSIHHSFAVYRIQFEDGSMACEGVHGIEEATTNDSECFFFLIPKLYHGGTMKNERWFTLWSVQRKQFLTRGGWHDMQHAVSFQLHATDNSLVVSTEEIPFIRLVPSTYRYALATTKTFQAYLERWCAPTRTSNMKYYAYAALPVLAIIGMGCYSYHNSIPNTYNIIPANTPSILPMMYLESDDTCYAPFLHRMNKLEVAVINIPNSFSGRYSRHVHDSIHAIYQRYNERSGRVESSMFNSNMTTLIDATIKRKNDILVSPFDKTLEGFQNGVADWNSASHLEYPPCPVVTFPLSAMAPTISQDFSKCLPQEASEANLRIRCDAIPESREAELMITSRSQFKTRTLGINLGKYWHGQGSLQIHEKVHLVSKTVFFNYYTDTVGAMVVPLCTATLTPA